MRRQPRHLAKEAVRADPDFHKHKRDRLRGSQLDVQNAIRSRRTLLKPTNIAFAGAKVDYEAAIATTFELNFPNQTEIAFVGAGAGRAKPPSAHKQSRGKPNDVQAEL